MRGLAVARLRAVEDCFGAFYIGWLLRGDGAWGKRFLPLAAKITALQDVLRAMDVFGKGCWHPSGMRGLDSFPVVSLVSLAQPPATGWKASGFETAVFLEASS